MSAEEESYATPQVLSPAEMPAIKKTGGRLIFSKRPPGMVFMVRLASGYVEACPPCLSCPWAACCPASLSGVPAAVVAAVVAADFAAVSAVPAGVSARAAGAAAVAFGRPAAVYSRQRSSVEPSAAPGSVSARPAGAPGPVFGEAVHPAAVASDRVAGSQAAQG